MQLSSILAQIHKLLKRHKLYDVTQHMTPPVLGLIDQENQLCWRTKFNYSYSSVALWQD